jgi:hypothetical protein
VSPPWPIPPQITAWHPAIKSTKHLTGRIVARKHVAATAAAFLPRPSGALEITHDGRRFISFEDRRATGIALALGFVLGAAGVALMHRSNAL